MSSFKLIVVALIAALLLGNAEADTAIDITVYNSEDVFSSSLDGENFRFNSLAAINRDSLKYKDGAISNDPICHYSYDAVLNQEKIGAGADTDSGGFAFGALADCNSNCDGSRSFNLQSTTMVKDGMMRSYNYNSKHRIGQTMDLTNAIYFQKGSIGTEKIDTSGKGGTIDIPEDSSSPDIKGVQSVQTVTGSKSASISQDVLGDDELLWVDNFESDSSGFVMEQKMKGMIRSPDGSFEMKGEATGFPDQILPPGEVDIKYRIYEPRLEEIVKDFSEEIEKFREEYPDASPGIFYYLNTRGYWLNPDIYNQTPLTPAEYFEMKMQFTVKG